MRAVVHRFRPPSAPERLLLWLLLLAAVPAHAAEGFSVLVSVKPVHSIVAGLMAGIEGPGLLVEEGTPFDFALAGEHRERVAKSDLVIWVGPELEPALAAAIDDLPSNVRVVELLASRSLKILPSRRDGERRDPFFWLDDRNVILLLDDLARLLAEVDPARAHVYARNRREVMARLQKIDREYEYGYRGLKAGLGVQYHDTLQYFEQAYALRIVDRVTGSPLDPVDAEALLGVRRHITGEGVACLLTEKGMEARYLDLLTEETGVNLGELDTLGVGLPPGPDLYFDLMARNTETIKRCLSGKRAQDARTGEAGAEGAAGAEGGRFLLTDHMGRLVSPETMLGKHQVLYFGYTFCPDICPTSLSVLFRALDLLGDRADLFQPYFITIDPERDTVAVMRGYVGYFDDRLIGVTGSPAMIDRMAAHYGVRYEKVTEESPDPSLYLMDHTASLYLVGPDGRYITKFLHGVTPEQLAEGLRAALP